MIRLKTRIGSKHKPGDIVADDALDAKLSARLIAEGRAERVNASDQTAQALKAAYRAMTAAWRSRLRALDQAIERASPAELEQVLADAFEEVLATGRERNSEDDGPASFSGTLDAAVEAHREALAQDAAVSAETGKDTPAPESGKKPASRGGKKDTRKAPSGTARKASSTASSGAVEGGAKASPDTAKAGGRTAGKPEAGKAAASAVSGEPTDQKRSGAEAARGIHNPEAGGSNPPSAPNPEADKA